MGALKRWKKPKRSRNPNATSRLSTPTLRFTPTAWAKLLYLRDVGDTEIGGFGISAVDDPLLVEDVRLLQQRCTAATVAFDDAAVADFFDEQVDAGLPPDRFSRVWLHTHPGNSPLPSCVDETTFARVFGSFHWSVMGIVARNDASYARLQYRVGPNGAFEISVGVDYSQPFGTTDHGLWLAEYERCVETHGGLDWLDDDFDLDKEWPPDWRLDPAHWEEFEHGALGSGSVRSAEGFGAAGATLAGMGDGDRSGSDRSPSGAPADGVGGAEAAID